MKSIHKEPLLHFLMLAIGLFFLHSAVSHNDDNDDLKRIVVNQDALLSFIQYRTKSFEPVTAQKQLESLSDEALERLVADYVREEALYREARSLGLDRDDYVIKRRQIQKINYIARGFAESTGEVTEKISASTTRRISRIIISNRASPLPISFSATRAMMPLEPQHQQRRSL